MRRLIATVVVGIAIAASGLPGAAQTASSALPAGAQSTAAGVPNRKDSLKFIAMGDNGDGSKAQYEVGAQMNGWRSKFAYDMVIMLGDNLYGSQGPKDFVDKFENPYKPMLDAGVIMRQAKPKPADTPSR